MGYIIILGIVFLGVIVNQFSGGFSNNADDSREGDDVLHKRVSGANGFVIVLLLLVILALGERILYDVARTLVGEHAYSYFDNLKTISLHAMIILPLFIAAIVINVFMGEQRQKYAIVLIPYFIATLCLTMQLALQFGVYFYYHHTQTEFYVVMTLLTVICSAAIYLIQEYFNKHLSGQQ